MLIFRKLFCVQTKAPKSGNLSLKKKIKHQFLKLFTFAFMWHGHFPARNGLNSRIVTQKTEPVNNASWLTQVFWVVILDFNPFLSGKLPSHMKAKLNIFKNWCLIFYFRSRHSKSEGWKKADTYILHPIPDSWIGERISF